jgi:hypothetical protein
MKIDRVFVLLLVVLLPMTGCFDDAVGDAEGTDDTDSGTTVVNNYYNQSTNLDPVFHVAGVGSDGDEIRSTYNSTTGAEETRMNYRTYQYWFSVTDIDSNISSVGLDTDLDMIIDYEFTNNGSWSDFSYHESYGFAWSNTTMAGSAHGQWGEEPIYCFQRFNLMALDDNGGLTVIPYTMAIGNNNGCDVSVGDD